MTTYSEAALRDLAYHFAMKHDLGLLVTRKPSWFILRFRSEEREMTVTVDSTRGFSLETVRKQLEVEWARIAALISPQKNLHDDASSAQ